MSGTLRRAFDVTSRIFNTLKGQSERRRIIYSRAVAEKTLNEFSNVAAESLQLQGKFFYKDLGRFTVSKRTGNIEFTPSKAFQDKVFSDYWKIFQSTTPVIDNEWFVVRLFLNFKKRVIRYFLFF